MNKFLSVLKLSFISLVSLVPSSLFGQASSSIDYEEGKGLLWEISGNGLEKPSYLFATIHIISKEDFIMTEVLQDRFAMSQQVVLELDMDDPKIMKSMLTQVMMRDGQSLKTLLSDEDYQMVSQFFTDTLGSSLFIFERMKPFMVMSFIYPKMLGEKTASYEMEFMKMAKTASLEILGLESVEDQLSIFDKIPYEEQAQMMVDFIKDYGEEKDKIQEMIDLYVAQDLKGLYEFTTSSPEMASYQDIMLDNRNENWISKMKEIMLKKNSFFAVGAGHLWGEKGVIQLLREEGFQVNVVE